MFHATTSFDIDPHDRGDWAIIDTTTGRKVFTGNVFQCAQGAADENRAEARRDDT